MSAETRDDAALAAALRAVADDNELLWNVARKAIEDELVVWRDDRMSMLDRGNGFVIREADRTPSSVIRFGPEVGVRIALKALADHFENAATNGAMT